VSTLSLYLFLFLCLCLLLYWQLVLAEGAHLGARVVVWLYDLVAPRYDRIKDFDAEVEADTLGLPLALALAGFEAPRVLDVACGTGRLARTLLPQVLFDGTVVNADLSARMLRCGVQASAALAGAAGAGRLAWLRAPADRLPLAASSFDAVACLEALEFLPDARAALGECVRVLRPGGVLLVSNRVGPEAWLMPGKTYSRAAFRRLLAGLPFEAVVEQRWQVGYDLVWARKCFEPQPVQAQTL
jgi:ubiquinone/menaquinone biosynthesis C-methylase UbiE